MVLAARWEADVPSAADWRARLAAASHGGAGAGLALAMEAENEGEACCTGSKWSEAVVRVRGIARRGQGALRDGDWGNKEVQRRLRLLTTKEGGALSDGR